MRLLVPLAIVLVLAAPTLANHPPSAEDQALVLQLEGVAVFWTAAPTLPHDAAPVSIHASVLMAERESDMTFPGGVTVGFSSGFHAWDVTLRVDVDGAVTEHTGDLSVGGAEPGGHDAGSAHLRFHEHNGPTLGLTLHGVREGDVFHLAGNGARSGPFVTYHLEGTFARAE